MDQRVPFSGARGANLIANYNKIKWEIQEYTMNKLLIMDEKDYTENMSIYEKYCVRAVIKNGDYIATQISKKGEYKIPGGKVELGEHLHHALAREVLEETGLTIKFDSIVEIGEIEEIREDKKFQGIKYICHSYYYTCDVFDETTNTNMSDNEKEEGYILEWATLNEIYNSNVSIQNEAWRMRDTNFVKMVIDNTIVI